MGRSMPDTESIMTDHDVAFKEYPILYVDDEKPNRVVMKHNLSEEFTLYLAETAHDALECLEKDFVAVLLADQRMPGMTGVELAEHALVSHPEVIRVIITAYSDLEVTIDAINRARVNRFIKKPWTPEELAAVMRESIGTYHNSQLLKEMQERLMQLDRMNSLAITAASIAHDLRQPLTCIVPNLGSVREELAELQALSSSQRLSGPQLHERLQFLKDGLDDIADGMDRFNTISEGLLTSLRVKRTTLQRIELQRVVHTAITLSRSTICRVARLVIEVADEPLYVIGSEGRSIQLVMNLLLNASQAVSAGATMSNHVTLRLHPDGDWVVIEVEDTGCGIRSVDLAHIFEPFFSTKGSTGSGLGLPICKQIVEEMRGEIRIDSTPGKGTSFVVRLPRTKAGSA